ncbi:MAG: formylglycine-generating enzyme family protein [Flavobacteriaceae bacterium]
MKKIVLIVVAIVATNVVKSQINTTFIKVQGGTFYMGGNELADESPIHKVTVSSFRITKHPITVGQYYYFCKETGRSMPDSPDGFGWSGLEDHPMVSVTYYDAVAYAKWLTKKTGRNSRLPTEAEWEYAARGGQRSKGNMPYSGSDNLREVAWFKENSNQITNPVGIKAPNELGIHDMSGNVWEWCSDWYRKNYYANSPKENPKGPSSGNIRIARGGSWESSSFNCRVSRRYGFHPNKKFTDLGFRIVQPVEESSMDDAWFDTGW